MPKKIVYIALSLDGRVADERGSVAWLDEYQDEDYGYDAFVAGLGALVMGRRTYDQVLGFGAWPYAPLPCYVLTTRPLEPDPPAGVVAWTESPDALLHELERQAGERAVWLVGGPQSLRPFIERGAVDRWEIFVMPCLLGHGPVLFGGGLPATELRLVEQQAYANGVLRLVYEPRRGGESEGGAGSAGTGSA